ncbi:MAG TPA: 16S rRNA (cytosine(1402)-N(4))-methyltransferase, partial [Patescibacteria group bacterium]|nr:16S rRNA (cytosine(1402)-N(4))-methyltransferase [Patescibacteria group bacterium]
MNTRSNLHIPVLYSAVIDLLSPKLGDTYLDLTAGYGGHAKGVIEKIGSPALATLVDQDDNAIQTLELLQKAGSRVIKQDFASYAKKLVADGECFDMVLIDLGVSSPQLDNAERGFSIQRSGPLDMRMDQSQTLTAADIANTYSVD